MGAYVCFEKTHAALGREAQNVLQSCEKKKDGHKNDATYVPLTIAYIHESGRTHLRVLKKAQTLFLVVTLRNSKLRSYSTKIIFIHPKPKAGTADG